jgi:hypothetical protein
MRVIGRIEGNGRGTSGRFFRQGVEFPNDVE